MKIIDLLNKIANGEEVPEKIKIDRYIFTRFNYYKGDGTYISSYQSDEGRYYISDYSYPQDLNRKVEIIEEHKIPEKIEEKEIDISMSIGEQICANKINEILNYLEINNE